MTTTHIDQFRTAIKTGADPMQNALIEAAQQARELRALLVSVTKLAWAAPAEIDELRRLVALAHCISTELANDIDVMAEADRRQHQTPFCKLP